MPWVLLLLGPLLILTLILTFGPCLMRFLCFFFFSKLLQDCLRALTNQTVHELFLLLLLLLSHFCRVRLCVTP